MSGDLVDGSEITGPRPINGDTPGAVTGPVTTPGPRPVTGDTEQGSDTTGPSPVTGDSFPVDAGALGGSAGLSTESAPSRSIAGVPMDAASVQSKAIPVFTST